MYSMTGFGSASYRHHSYVIGVEVKSLNSKYADVRVKAPSELSVIEMEARHMALETAIRGKIEITLSLEGLNLGGNMSEIDDRVFKDYYKQLIKVSRDLDVEASNLFPAIVQLPGVVKLLEFKVDDQLQTGIRNTLRQALLALMDHRKKEGAALSLALTESIRNIKKGQSIITRLEPERMDLVRTRLRDSLDQYIPPDKIDNGRYEQELIYYLDKMDIHEEMVRLNQHCDYFLQEIGNNELTKGKKLSFISQEIGREINTLGSKANHAEIQHIVVEMKNEVDKVKEQLANVL